MHSISEQISIRIPSVPKLHFLIIPLLLMIIVGTAGCKPTEKNYRSAYDVAREKHDREQREREELRRDLGIGEGVIQDVDDYTLSDIGGEQVWVRHLNFARTDSVSMYAVGVATFKMDTNARAMASDLVADGWHSARCAGADKSWFVIIGESSNETEAIGILRRFRDASPKWQYVGQPGIALLVGGSR